ncbi:MAG: hypothetical protein PHV18_06125 [Lachnospiraceae bacterium]|nr:hypothetical protein [Lachnospiraceae bacterium]
MKKVIKALALAAVLVSMPVMAFASYSGSNDDSGSSSSSNTSSGTTASVGSNGSVSLSSSDAKGTSIGVQTGVTTSTGETVTTNARGEAVIGDKAVAFATGVAATAGLPERAVASISAINSGANLAEATGNAAFAGYNALTGTHAIVVKSAATEQVVEEPVEVSLYVSNLMADLGSVSVAFYDNVTGQWMMIPITAMDLNSKTVSVKVPGNGTLSVIYKK